jgi:hypothetical protein
MLLITLPPFPMYIAFLYSEYYDGSATTRRPRRASRLPFRPHGLSVGWATPGRFPRSLMSANPEIGRITPVLDPARPTKHG